MLDNRFEVDKLSFPVVFLYRHHVELALKTIISLGAQLLDEPWTAAKIHNLRELWNVARTVIERRWAGGDPKPVDAAEALILELNAHDPLSFAFRYPTKKDDSPSLDELRSFNVGHFAETVGRLSNFLKCCVFGLSAELGIKEEMESELRSMYDPY